MAELKPCPFYGGVPYMAQNYLGQKYVRCTECGACVGGKDTDDYISREAALDMCDDDYDRIRIRGLPTADVRPVVLCRDCRWWTKQEKSLQGRCELAGFYPTGEWFCANGERPNCGADMREV